MLNECNGIPCSNTYQLHYFVVSVILFITSANRNNKLFICSVFVSINFSNLLKFSIVYTLVVWLLLVLYHVDVY